MKRDYIFAASVLIGVLLGSSSQAVTKQSQSVGYQALPSVTATQALTLVVTTGTAVYCSNCGGGGGAGTICVSTGVAANSLVLSTGSHCQ